LTDEAILDAMEDRPSRPVPLDSQHLNGLAERWRRGATVGCLLGAWENFVFRLEKGREAAILRITEEHRRSEEEIAGELRFMEHLDFQGFPVPVVQRFRDGTSTLSIQAGERRFTVCLFNEVVGRQVSARSILDDPIKIESWGTMIGQLHNAASSFRSARPIRRNWAENDLIALSPFGAGLPRQYLPVFRSTVADFRERIVSDDDFGLVHGDLHGRNVLAAGSTRTVIDFDDMCYHWHGYDLAVAWNWLCHAGGESDRICGTLLTGYARVRNVSRETDRLLPKLAFLRTCLDFMFIDRHARAGVQSPLIAAHLGMLARCLRAQVAAAA
jgi:Ser/Thr protein kinase RdoA (MazF antagonist)